MHRQKVVIADANEEFTDALAQALSGDFQVRICANGAAAMELIGQWEPDILILELTLSHMDGLSIIQRLSDSPRPPRMLVISGMLTEYVQLMLAQLGIQYALQKPCLISAALERVREIAALDAPPQSYPTLYTAMASDLLMELGLSNQRLGFQHMLAALPLLMVHRDRRLTKELYEEVSAVHNSCPTRIEKNIRDTVREAWNHRNPEIWSRYFPGETRCPKNKAFLFRLTDVLMERLLREAG